MITNSTEPAHPEGDHVRRHRTYLLAALLALAVGVSGCAADDALSGRVVDDLTVVQAPSLPVPPVDLNSGFAGAQPIGASSTRSGQTTIQAITGLGSAARIVSVNVEPGDEVRAGQAVATFDAAALDASLDAARAAHASARAQLPVLDEALDKVDSGKATLASTRAQITDAIAKLTTTRAQLVAKRAQVAALLAKLQQMGGALPPGGVPTMPPGGTPPTGTPPPVPPNPAQLRAALAQLDAGIAKIDAGLAKARSGLGTLSSARAKLSDARAQLLDVRELARIAADASSIGVAVATYQRSLAVVRAPVSGRVVSAVRAGEVLAPGASVVRIREAGPARVSLWLTPEQARALEQRLASSGQPVRVTVSGDWAPDEAQATVTRIGVRAEYPPTSFATREVHLTRAIPVEVTVVADDDYPLPPGAPVDVRIE